MPGSFEQSRTDLIPTPAGDARALFSPARDWPAGDWPAGDSPAEDARAVFVVGHGAGGGFGARDLVAVRRALPPRGIAVVAVEQPWKVAGRKVAAAPRQLDVAWLVAVPAVLAAFGLGVPLVLGGRSAGARVACRTATALGAAGVVALAFPLHPPGRPDRSRLDELLGAGVPTLVVQGERDSFGRPEEFPDGEFRLCSVPAADHGFTVPKAAPVSQAEALSVLVAAVTGWLDELLADGPGNPARPRAVDAARTAESGGSTC